MGIIAAIAVPAIGGLISSQRVKAVEAQLAQIEDAARLHLAENPTDTSIVYTGEIADYITLAGGFENITFTAENGQLKNVTVPAVTYTFNGATYSITANGLGAYTVKAS